jgi:hypothetical protein
LLIFRARNEEWSHEGRTTEVGRCLLLAEFELATAKESMARNVQALVDSLERSGILEEELGQLRDAARSVVREVLGPRPGSSALAADLLEVPGEVAGLITDGVFYGTSGVFASVASHYPTLDFEAVRRGYTTGWSADQLRELGQSLVPITSAIAEVTTMEWVKEARCTQRAAALGGDGGQYTEAESSATPTEPAPN